MNLTLRRCARTAMLAGFACLTSISLSSTAHAQDTIVVTGGADQKFDGFGGAEAFDSNALATQASNLTLETNLYNDIFSNLNLNFLRLNLEESFSPSSGTYDYNTAVRTSGQEAVINAARTRNPNLKVFYAAWSPPAYMKSDLSGDPNSGNIVGGMLMPADYSVFGSYLAEFTKEFNTNESYPVSFLSLQNEPDQVYTYDSCLYNPSQYASTLAAIAPAVRSVASANGYYTNIIGPEPSNPATGTGNTYFQSIMSDGGSSLFDYAACHSYWGTMAQISPAPSQPIYQTEWADIADGNTDTGAPMAAKTTAQFCQDFNYGLVKAWFYWWLSWLDDVASGEGQGLALRTQDTGETEPWTAYTLTPKYYAFKALTNTFLPNATGRATVISTGYAGDLQAAGALNEYGQYALAVSNASTTAHSSVQLTFDELAGTGNLNFTRILVDSTDNYTTSTVVFANGVYTDSFPAATSCFYLQQLGTGTEAPYSTVPAIPGTVYFPNYDLGGDGVGYHDHEAANQGGAYRTDGVDISTCSDTGSNGYCVGWCNPGEWLRYTVNVSQAGAYTVTFRVANGSTYTNIFHLENAAGQNISGPVSVAPTGGYGTFASITAPVDLAAGQQVLRLVEDTGGYNLNYMSFALSSAGSAPGTPSSVAASASQWTTTGPAPGQVAITWNASSGATSYTVYRGASSGSETPYMANLTGTHYTDVGLANGETYYYKVVALNAFGSSSASSEVSGTPATSGSAPAAPTGLTATAGSTQVALSWTASSGATSYNILRSTTSGSGYTSVVSGVTATSYTNTGLVNGTAYYYVVTATNSSGTSGDSSQASATPQAAVPAAPTGLTATAGNTQIALSWSASSGATSYNVLRSTTSGSGYSSLATGLTTTSYTNTGLVNGTAYYYVVTATNTAGTSGNSSQATATPRVGIPAAPTGLTATGGNTQVALSWTASSGATSYNVLRSTTSGSGFTSVATGITTTSYTNTGLSNGTLYYYVVTATNTSGTSGDSAQVSATPAGVPAAPTGLTATAGNTQVALSWSASTGATSYNVSRSTTSGSGYTSVVTGLTTTSYTNTGLSNGTPYYYVVTATNASGTSGYSSQASATPQASSIPAAPTGLSAALLAGEVNLSWSASSGATSYTVLRSQNSGSGYVAIASGITSTTYEDFMVTNGLTYYYVVTASNSSGTSGNSSQVSASPVGNGNAPGATNYLTATASTGQVSLTWDAATGATSYNILRSTSSGTGFSTLTTGVTGTSYTDTHVVHGTTYYYIVSGSNSYGSGSLSQQSGATP